MSASSISLLKTIIIEPRVTIITIKEIIIFIGKPTTSRLNDGIVFISMPKTISAKRDIPITGKESIKPT